MRIQNSPLILVGFVGFILSGILISCLSLKSETKTVNVALSHPNSSAISDSTTSLSVYVTYQNSQDTLLVYQGNDLQGSWTVELKKENYSLIISQLNAEGEVISRESYNFTNDGTSIIVQPKLELFPKELDLIVGGFSEQISLAVLPLSTSEQKAIWSSRDLEVAIVSENGIISAKGKGSTYILAKSATGLIDSVLVKVREDTENLKPVNIISQPIDKTVLEGGDDSFSVTAEGSQLSYQWYKNSALIEGATGPILKLESVDVSDSGSQYFVLISNSLGLLSSDTVTLAVEKIEPDPVFKITQQPQSLSVSKGDSAKFLVEVEGENLQYQWYKEENEIPEERSFSLTLPDVSPTDSGSYKVQITDKNDSIIFSETAELTVRYPPIILFQSGSKSVMEGSSLELNISAAGYPYPSFQWIKDSVEISGADSSRLLFPLIVSEDAGVYWVKLSNEMETVFSDTINIGVQQEPIPLRIISQPENLTVVEGETATLSVSAEGMDVYYQWSKNGSDITDANKSSLEFSTVAREDSGSYSVRVSDSSGQLESESASLTVHFVPEIVESPKPDTVILGQPVNLTVSAIGNPPPQYQWYKNDTEISGETDSALTISDSRSEDAGRYKVVASNSVGQKTSGAVDLVILSPPAIISHPSSVSKDVGQTATFTVTATGSAPLTYLWKRGNLNVGTNASSYTTDILQLSDNGADFTVEISNTAGNVVSNVATLTVMDVIPAVPTNLTANKIGNKSIELTWDDNSINETHFIIERDLSPAFNSPISVEIAANTTTYEENDLQINTSYYFRIRSETVSGLQSNWSINASERTWACAEPYLDERDNTYYETVKIGVQCWFSENLNYAGNSATGNTCYDNLPDNCNKYGRMYSWEITVADNHGNGKDICPEGFHVPLGDGEGWSLFDYIDSNSGTWSGNPKSYMSETITSGPMFENCSQGEFTNPFGFSMLTGGYYHESPFENTKQYLDEREAGYFWFSDPPISSSAQAARFTWSFGCEATGVWGFDPRWDKNYIRCLSDISW